MVPRQTFQGPVGQVAAGNINNNQSKWDLLSLDELQKIKAEYAAERTRAWLAQYLNRYAAATLIACICLGVWGQHMIQIGGLVGEVTTEKMATLIGFAVVILTFCFGLHRLRATIQATIAELDDDLKKINQAIRFKKSTRNKK